MTGDCRCAGLLTRDGATEHERLAKDIGDRFFRKLYSFLVISVFSQDWLPLGYAFFCLLMLCVVCVMDVRRNLATSAPGAPGRGELTKDDEDQDSDEARL